MWTYIRQEKECLTRLMKDDSISSLAKQWKDKTKICMIAHGSSYNAAFSVAPLFEKVAGMQVICTTPSRFIHNMEKSLLGDALYVAISQTGNSRGVLEAIRSVSQGATLAITEKEGLLVDTCCKEGLYLHCGPEESNAKTKGYSCTVLALMLLCVELAVEKGMLSQQERENIRQELELEIEQLDTVIDQTIRYCEETSFGKGCSELYFLGDGIQLGTAMEGQLKLMETLCVPTCFNDLVEFSHGMHRAMTQKSQVILIDDGTEPTLADQSVAYLKKIHTPVLHLSNRTNGDIQVPAYVFSHSLLSMIAVIQVLSVFIPEINGLDPNRNAHNDYTDAVNTRIEEM